MKVSISLPDDGVEFLDSYADRAGFGARSAVVHKAVRQLLASDSAPPTRSMDDVGGRRRQHLGRHRGDGQS